MNTTWVYIQSEPGLWTVGFYAPDGTWHPDSDHSAREEAAGRVHWLNGGGVFALDCGDILSQLKLARELMTRADGESAGRKQTGQILIAMEYLATAIEQLTPAPITPQAASESSS